MLFRILLGEWRIHGKHGDTTNRINGIDTPDVQTHIIIHSYDNVHMCIYEYHHLGFKHDVSCIVRSEALRGHSDTSTHSALRASCIDWSSWPLRWRIPVAPLCLRSHNARYIMLRSDYNMNYLVLIHYEAEIFKRSSEAGGGESSIVENLCMVLYVMCTATPLWR